LTLEKPGRGLAGGVGCKKAAATTAAAMPDIRPNELLLIGLLHLAKTARHS
jgi:hypothetical protein